MRRIAAIALAAGLIMGLAACGEDKVDKQGTIDNLVESGMDEETATCMVNGLTDELGDEKVLAFSEDPEGGDLSAEDQEKVVEITTDCLGLGDISIPDVSIPDISIPDVSIPEE